MTLSYWLLYVLLRLRLVFAFCAESLPLQPNCFEHHRLGCCSKVFRC